MYHQHDIETTQNLYRSKLKFKNFLALEFELD